MTSTYRTAKLIAVPENVWLCAVPVKVWVCVCPEPLPPVVPETVWVCVAFIAYLLADDWPPEAPPARPDAWSVKIPVLDGGLLAVNVPVKVTLGDDVVPLNVCVCEAN